MSGHLVNPLWTVSKSATEATTTYGYSFTTATGATLSSVTMTVPPGTSGTPLVGTVTGVPTTETFSLSGNVLTYSFKSTHLNPGTTVSITVTGMTNTRTTGATPVSSRPTGPTPAVPACRSTAG